MKLVCIKMTMFQSPVLMIQFGGLTGGLGYMLLDLITHLLLCNSAGFHILCDILNNRFARLTDLMRGLYTAMISQSMSEDTSLSLSLAMISNMRSASLDFLTDRILMSSNLLTHYYGLCSTHLLWLQ